MEILVQKETSVIRGGGYTCGCFGEGSTFTFAKTDGLQSKTQCRNFCCRENSADYYQWAFTVISFDRSIAERC